jgi:hypothetical protein
MSMIPIDKGIPLPEKFPFERMDVGDSFLVPQDISRSTVNVAATRYGEKWRMKFTVRKTPEGLRCWRIE